jgi:hypothetical protein
MITKCANAILGGLSGFMSSHFLDDDERRILRKEHGLSPDANLVVRNTGRGITGGAAGSIAGMALNKLMRKPVRSMTPLTLGTSLLGSGLSTMKYSKPAASAIRLRDVEDALEYIKNKQ